MTFRLQEEERRKGARSFLASVRVARPTKTPQQQSEHTKELTDGELRVLTAAALTPEKRLLQIYEELGFYPAAGRRVVDELQAKALVRLHRLAKKPGRGGGQPCVLEILDKGSELLKARGIVPATRLLARGGFKHDVYARWIRAWAARNHFKASFERSLGVKAFDVVLEDDDGWLRAIEICVSGSTAWNVQQGYKAASVEGIQEVTIAVDNKKVLTRLGRVFAQGGEDGGLFKLSKKIKCRHLGEYWPYG